MVLGALRRGNPVWSQNLVFLGGNDLDGVGFLDLCVLFVCFLCGECGCVFLGLLVG